MNVSNKLQITILCSFLIAVPACSSISTPNTSVAPSSPTNATAPLTASADPRADMVKAMRASLDAKSYRSRIATTAGSDGHNINITAEFVAPDRMRIVTEMDMPGQSPNKSERIYIGKQSYARAGDAPWQKDSLDMSDMFSQMRDPKLIEAVQKAEVKYVGTESLNGAPMLIYQYKIKDVLGTGIDSNSKMWIGATDNLQHQVETESDFADPSNTGKMMHSKTTITFYDYNTDIKIEPPM